MHRIAPNAVDGALVVPDGSADLVWMDGELMVAGPDERAHRERVMPGTTVVGLRFARGAASSWLGLPMSELVGRRVPLREIVGQVRTDEIADPIRFAGGSRDALLALERAVRGASDPANAHFATSVIAAIKSAVGDGAILPAIRRTTGLSERTLRRRCHEVFGYGPRTLSRVLRLQRLLAVMRHERGVTLAGAAVASGYADQPHMSREVRALTTMPATQLLAWTHGGDAHGRNVQDASHDGLHLETPMV